MRIDEVEKVDEIWYPFKGVGTFGARSLVPKALGGTRDVRLATNKANTRADASVRQFASANATKWAVILRNLKKTNPDITPDELDQKLSNYVNSLKVPETASMDLTTVDPNKVGEVMNLFKQIGSAIQTRQAAGSADGSGGTDMASLYKRFTELLAKGTPASPLPGRPVPESRTLKEALTPEEQEELDNIYAQLVKSGGKKNPKISALLTQYEKSKETVAAAPTAPAAATATPRPEEAGMDPAASQKTTTVGKTAQGYIDYLTKAIGEEPDMAAKVAMVKKYINAIINVTKADGTYKFAMKPMQDIIAQHEFDLGGAESDTVKKAKAAIASAKPMESKIYRQLKKILEAHGVTLKSLGYSVLIMESKSKFVYISKRK